MKYDVRLQQPGVTSWSPAPAIEAPTVKEAALRATAAWPKEHCNLLAVVAPAQPERAHERLWSDPWWAAWCGIAGDPGAEEVAIWASEWPESPEA